MKTQSNWRNILEEFLSFLDQLGLDYANNLILAGSAATALQGCDISPNDLDFLSKSPEFVEKIASKMIEFEVEESPSQDIDHWLSSKNQRVLIIENDSKTDIWYLGRWYVNDFKIEIAYIRDDSYLEKSRKNNMIWENGPDMYPFVKNIDIRGYVLPIIPLELQLSSNFLRNLEYRSRKIIKVLFEVGFDLDLLHNALSDEQLDRFNIIKEGITN